MTFTDPYQQSYPPSLWETPLGETFSLPGDVDHFTIDQIKQWVDDHESQAQAVLSAEEARDAPRSSLLDWLRDVIAPSDNKNTRKR